MRRTYAKDHGEALHATHACGLEVAHTYEPLVLHLLDGDIVHEAGYDGARTGLLAKVDLLDIEPIRVWVLLDY